MLKKILAIMAMLYAAACFAAVDVNKATAAELDSIKDIGPGISTKILDERKKGNFKDWTDLVDRVKGVGELNAAKFSSEGLTVNGTPFKGVAATPAAKKDEKKADTKLAMPATAAPATTNEVKVDAKAQAAADKEAAKKAKADAKQAKADEAKKAKEAKAAAKAEAAKPAASAAKK